MPYCTLQQLTDRYSEALLIEISDRGAAPTGTIDAALIARAIADADALIDGYAKPRYALPLSPVPPLVTDLSLAIAVYKAHAHVAGEKIRKDYEDALKVLRDIGTGTVRLDVAGVEPGSGGFNDVRFNEPARPLSAEAMRGFI